MTNEERIAQLKFREERISELMPLQTDPEVQGILSAESVYVSEQIRFWNKWGDRPLNLVLPDKPASAEPK